MQVAFYLQATFDHVSVTSHLALYESEEDRKTEKLMGHTTSWRRLRCHHGVGGVKRGQGYTARERDNDTIEQSCRRRRHHQHVSE